MTIEINEESDISGKNRGSDCAGGFEGGIGPVFSETGADEREIWKMVRNFPSSERNMRAV